MLPVIGKDAFNEGEVDDSENTVPDDLVDGLEGVPINVVIREIPSRF